MMAPPLGRCRLDTRVSRGAALRGLGVQRGSPSDKEAEEIGDGLDSGGVGVASTGVMLFMSLGGPDGAGLSALSLSSKTFRSSLVL